MGTFNIISSTLNNQYEYKDTAIVVNGSYSKDALNGTLQSISGQAYRVNEQGQQGDYIGNFNGYPKDGDIVYDLSQMNRRDSNLVWDAIDEIEPNVTGNNE